MRTFSVYYFVFFIAMASTQPFLSLYLDEKGMSSTQIGLLLAAGSCIGMIAQPILGYINDRASDARRLLFWAALLSPILFAGYALLHQFWTLFVVSIAVAVVQSASPIADAMAVQEGGRSGFSYGQVRLWGALSFAIGTSVAGYLYSIVGIQLAFTIYGVLTVLILVTILKMPKETVVLHEQENLFQGIWNVARNPKLTSFIVLCFILSTAITINAVYLPLYFKTLGYPMRFVGLNFTVAALTEVPLFYLSDKLMSRFGHVRVLMIGTLLYTVKYAVMAFAPGAFTVIAIQVLDGVGYAFYWSAGVQVVAMLAPEGRSATAQTLYGAIASSLSSIVGSSLGGFLLDKFGPIGLFGYTTAIGAASLIGFLLFTVLTGTLREKRVETCP